MSPTLKYKASFINVYEFKSINSMLYSLDLENEYPKQCIKWDVVRVKQQILGISWHIRIQLHGRLQWHYK